MWTPQVIHCGRQRVGIISILDQSSSTIIELRSDHASDTLWARDNRGNYYHSPITVGDEWWCTRVAIAGDGCVRVATAKQGADFEKTSMVWATVVPNGTYDQHRAVCAVTLALGDEGAGLFIREIQLSTMSDHRQSGAKL